ncbi:MAG: hypothetical protein LRZ88_04230 [Candidatus Cloacimonetes bacterium]|nr:hypothetical protein [Candidatus Cloacimonadota bacterium]
MKTAKFVLILLITLLLSSCQNPFRPELRDNSSASILNRNPEELLRNLEKAYQEKNINIFKQLLHEDYRFEMLQSEVNSIGIDMDGDGIRDSWWDRDKEIEITENMFISGSSDGNFPVADKIELRLQIPPQELWELDPAEGRENWIIIPAILTSLSPITPQTAAISPMASRAFMWWKKVGAGTSGSGGMNPSYDSQNHGSRLWHKAHRSGHQ